MSNSSKRPPLHQRDRITVQKSFSLSLRGISKQRIARWVSTGGRSVVVLTAIVALVTGPTVGQPLASTFTVVAGTTSIGVDCDDSGRATTFDAPCLMPDSTTAVSAVVVPPVEVEEPEEERLKDEPISESAIAGSETIALGENLTQAGGLRVWAASALPANSSPVTGESADAPVAETAPVDGESVSGAASEPAEADDEGSTDTPTENPVVQVEVLDEAEAEVVRSVVGTTGPVVRFVPDESGNPVPAKVAIDIEAFEGRSDSVGGGWSDRAALVAYPACVVETPEVPECQTSVRLDTTLDAERRLVATVPDLGSVAGTNSPTAGVARTAASASGVVLVAAATPAGAGDSGDWTATSLGTASTWSAGGSSGSFTWSYPFRLPPVASGFVPSVGLSYDSASVDGVVGSDNPQSSWVGLGWDLSPGFLERTYVPCEEDRDDFDGAEANNKSLRTGDLCWRGEVLSLSLSGHASEVVSVAERENGDAERDTYRLRTDDGSILTRVGVKGGPQEHFVLETMDGTKYVFGESASDATSNSSLRVPVYGNHPGERGYHSTFRDSRGSDDRVWRWNLAQVIDPRGNTINYTWAKEKNRYRAGTNLGPVAQRGGESVRYDRGATLSSISYGTRTGESTDSAPATVEFQVAERCRKKYDCSPPRTLTKSNQGQWPDVPFDQVCETNCKAETQSWPTFFTTKRLARVVTESGGQPVDQWILSHSFPTKSDPRDDLALWLSNVTHQAGANTILTGGALNGKDGGTVSFGVPKMLANRVDTSSDNLPPMYRPRIQTIVDELGGTTSVAYSEKDCRDSAGHFPDPATNTRRCFPSRASYDTFPKSRHWFNRYVVDSVVQSAASGAVNAAASGPVRTQYQYGTESVKAAWAQSDDPGVLQRKKRWNQWRGYATVTTSVGDVAADAPGHPATKTVTRYHRGLGLPNATVANDPYALAGMVKSTTTYDGDTEVSSSATVYSVDETTFKDDGSPRVAARAPRRVLPHATTDSRPRAQVMGGGDQVIEVRYTYDGLGREVRRDNRAFTQIGTAEMPVDQTCTYTDYAAVNGALRAYPSQSRVTAGACGSAPTSVASLLSGTQWLYDGGVLSAAPSRGLVTHVNTLDHSDGQAGTGPIVWVRVSSTSYDPFGRQVKGVDAAGSESLIAYEPATGGATPATVTTTSADPDGAGPGTKQVEVTTFDPKWAVPTKIVDATGATTKATYDALGRLTSVTKPGNSSGTPDVAYRYQVNNVMGSDGRPGTTNAITTTTRVGGATDTSTLTSVSLLDGLGRSVQMQAETRWTNDDNVAKVGRVFSSTEYDNAGRVRAQHSQTLADGAPETGLVRGTAASAQAPQTVSYTYDGAGRQLTQRTSWPGSETADSVIKYTYDANLTHVTPPAGGVATTAVVDARGRTIEQWRHTDGTPDSAEPDERKVVTTYGYDASGQMTTVRDEAGNTWRYSYDQRGRRIKTVDPDAGVSTTAYDLLGQRVLTTDGNGESLRQTYDKLGRQTGLYLVGGNASADLQLSAWSYDTVKTGLLASTTRFENGDPVLTQKVTAYDLNGRPTDSTSVLVAGGAVPAELAGSYRIEQAYRADGTVDSTSYRAVKPGGVEALPAEKVTYDYDPMSRPTRMGGSLGQYVVATAYSAYGQIDQLALGNTYGLMSWQSYRYDKGSGRLLQAQVDRQTKPELDQLRTYSYDTSGNPLSVRTDTQAKGASGLSWQETECYRYDDGLNRLTSAWSGKSQTCGVAPTSSNEVPTTTGYASNWMYDDVTNNRLSERYVTSSGSTLSEYSYPSDSSAGPVHAPRAVTVTAAGGVADQALAARAGSYTYNEAGQMVSRPGAVASAASGGVQALAWDAEHNLASAGDGAAPGADEKALYDTAGSRFLRAVTTAAGTVTTVYLPGGVELVHDAAKSTGAGTQPGEVIARRNYSFAGQLIATRTGNDPKNVTTWGLDPHGTPKISVANAETAFDTQSADVAQRRERPFGGDRGVLPSTEQFPGEIGFVGSTRDADVGFLQVGARPYDPYLGIFLTVDPLVDLADPSTLNAYAYAAQNPVSLSDPSGLAAVCVKEGTCEAKSNAKGGPPTPIRPTPQMTDDQRFYAATEASVGYKTGKRPDSLVKIDGAERESGPIIQEYLSRHLANENSVDRAIAQALAPDPGQCHGHGLLGDVAGCTFEFGSLLFGPLKGLKAGVETADALRDLDRATDAANAGTKLGWSTGDDIYSLTKAGNQPAWSTVRGRFWKNEAATPQIDSWSTANLDRMKRGLAPQRFNRDKGGLESMDLSHEPIPLRDGGTNVVPRWPQDHATVDPYRFPGY